MTQDKRNEVIAKYYGLEKHIPKFFEEAGEMVAALGKLVYEPSDAALEDFVSEVADMEIMIANMKHHFGIHKQVEQAKEFKINRQLKRIAEEKEKQK